MDAAFYNKKFKGQGHEILTLTWVRCPHSTAQEIRKKIKLRVVMSCCRVQFPLVIQLFDRDTRLCLITVIANYCKKFNYCSETERRHYNV